MQLAKLFYLITLEGCRDYAVMLKDWQKAVLPTLRKIIQPKNWLMDMARACAVPGQWTCLIHRDHGPTIV
jgi:hypothetical protein